MPDGEVTPTQVMVLLDTLESGRFAESMNDSLTEIIQKLHQHQQNAGGNANGTLTITLSMKHDGTHMIIAGQVTLKVPKPVRGNTIYFRTDDNGLSTEHPKQLHLPLVDASAGEPTPTMRVM